MSVCCFVPFGALLPAVRTWTTTIPSNRVPSAASSSSALTRLQKGEETPGNQTHPQGSCEKPHGSGGGDVRAPHAELYIAQPLQPAAQILPFSQLLPSGRCQVLVVAAGRMQEDPNKGCRAWMNHHP